jgi:hypothetical protein
MRINCYRFGGDAMSSKAYDSFRRKVDDIFRELAGAERAKWLEAGVPSRCMRRVAEAVNSESGYPKNVARNIGFNVADWQADAAFLVALHLFTERFTDEEIDRGVLSLLIHVPAHVIAAARLAGHSTEDIFKELEERAEPGAPNPPSSSTLRSTATEDGWPASLSSGRGLAPWN